MITDFEEVESLFTKLLAALTPIFSESEIAEVQRFIDVGEYGLALETAVDIFVEEKKKPSVVVMQLFKMLAAAMETDLDPLIKKLEV